MIADVAAVRQQTRTRLAEMMASFRQGIYECATDDNADPNFPNDERLAASDSDLVIFLATAVEKWIHRTGQGHPALQSMVVK